MFSARLAALPSFAAAAFAGFAAVLAPPAAAGDSVDLRYEVYGFAGLHVLTNSTRTQETPNGYSITMNLQTRGLASAFVDLWSHSEVRGVLSGDLLRPAAYHSEVRRNGTDRRYGLEYQGDGSVVDKSVVPTAAALHVDGARTRGTVDQLTAYYLLERQLSTRRLCRLVIPVFDGSELYRLKISDVGDETLSPDNRQNFSGPTHVCDLVREVVVANPDKKEGTYEHAKAWYAPLLPGRRMVPVRMEYDTAFGDVQVYLAEISGDGIHRRFMDE